MPHGLRDAGKDVSQRHARPLLQGRGTDQQVVLGQGRPPSHTGTGLGPSLAGHHLGLNTSPFPAKRIGPLQGNRLPRGPQALADTQPLDEHLDALGQLGSQLGRPADGPNAGKQPEGQRQQNQGSELTPPQPVMARAPPQVLDVAPCRSRQADGRAAAGSHSGAPQPRPCATACRTAGQDNRRDGRDDDSSQEA